MERSHRKILAKHRKSIVLDLEPFLIQESLVERNVLTQELMDKVIREKSDGDQAQKLLDILPSRGPDAFQSFVEILRKDYEWLVDLLESDTNGQNLDGPDEMTLVEQMLLQGGVPSLPNHTVQRTDKIQYLKDKLSVLNQGDTIVLHGWAGSGKTVLVSDVLHRPDITLQYFPDGVFWFRVGMMKEESALLRRMKIFLEKLDAPNVPTNLEHAQEILRKLFLSPRYKQSLLILDDVWEMFVIRAFDVGARIVATTRDLSITEGVSRVSIIDLQSGLEEPESLELFSSYVDIPTEYLPEEAKLIHQECKGSPMVISMIGSLISETGSRHSNKQQHSERWGNYLNSLSVRRLSRFRKRFSYNNGDSLQDNIMRSIDNLDETLRRLYQSLVVFINSPIQPSATRSGQGRSSSNQRLRLKRRKEIKFGGSIHEKNRLHYEQMSYRGILLLPYEVLMTYWDMGRENVEDVLREFTKKSLVLCENDDVLDSFIYNVHNLQLSFSQDDPQKEKELHKLFVDKYLAKVDYKHFGDIPDDSYILSNLGYHLFKSGEVTLFSEIYLDLGFLVSLLKVHSPVDVLNDYKTFEDQLIGPNEEHIEDLDDFEKFVRTLGAAFDPEVDLIQLALREPEKSTVYQKAKALVQTYPSRLYFDWTNRDMIHQRHLSTISHFRVIHAAIFQNDMTKVLTCNGDGQIRMWDILSGDVCHRFTGHKAAVRAMVLSPDGDLFASGSEDGAIKIWDLGNYQEPESDNPEMRSKLIRKMSTKHRSPGAKGARPGVTKFLTFDHELRDLSNQSFQFQELNNEVVLSVGFNPEGDEVVAGGASGIVKVFNLRARSLRLSLDGHRQAVNVCRFSNDGRYIATGSDGGSVRLWRADNGSFLGSMDNHRNAVLDLVFVPESTKVISLSPNLIVQWCSEKLGADINEEKKVFKRMRHSDFLKMALSPDGILLAVASRDNLITIWAVESAQVLAALSGHTSQISTLDITRDGSFLLSGGADESLMVWSLANLIPAINIPQDHRQLMSLGPAFDVNFAKDGTCWIAAADDVNRIQILRDGKPIYTSISDGSFITSVSLAKDISSVAFGCKNGSVRLFEPARNIVKMMGIHEKRVNSVKISRSPRVIASVSQDGVLKLFREGYPELTCSTCPSPLLAVHFLNFNNTVLIRSKDVVSTWDINSGNPVNSFQVAKNGDLVTSMDGCPTTGLLALGMESGIVTMLRLSDLALVNTFNPPPEFEGHPVQVCRLSDKCTLLAVGYDTTSQEDKSSGSKSSKSLAVVVLDTSEGNSSHKTLVLSKSGVSDIVFSKDSVHLVTVGDKMAWWSLDTMKNTGSETPSVPQLFAASRHKRSNDLRRVKMQNEKGENEKELKMVAPQRSGTRKISKVGNSSSKELLQVFDIKGSSASMVFAAKDFHKFATIDDAGILYILEEIKSAGKPLP